MWWCWAAFPFCLFPCREWRRLRTCATRWSRCGRRSSTTTNTKSASAGRSRKGCVSPLLPEFNAKSLRQIKFAALSADQAAVLPRQSLGEDPAEQLAGVPWLWNRKRDTGACGGSLWTMPHRLRSLWGVLDQGSTSSELALFSATSLHSPQQRWFHMDSVKTSCTLFACNVDMWLSVVLGDGQLATQDMTAAFANYYVASSSSPTTLQNLI